MKKLITISLLLALLAPASIMAGPVDNKKSSPVHKTEIKGKVIDKDSHEELVCAFVSLEGTNIKVATDVEGNFILKGIDPGTYTLEISYISYKTTRIEDATVKVNEPGDLLIQLEQQD